MDDFLCGLTGHIVTPLNPVYHEARQGFNRAIQRYPFIIVYCENKCDVSNAVIWSREHRIPIRIRSGGHNYEGYSNGDWVLIIDISRLNNMEIYKWGNHLYVEAGVNNKQLYEFVTSNGYPFPGGTCPTVGVSGYTLGGGWGLSCRYLGLGCDSLEEIEIVNYKGKLIKANCFMNSDLFWACRGAGGGNYGIVVSMSFHLPKPINKVTLIEIDYQKVSSEEQEKFKSASRFVLKDFSYEEISEITGLIKERPPGSVFTGISLYAMGGKVKDLNTDDTAFYYRRARYIIWLETIWENNQYAKENKKWIHNQFPLLKAMTTGSYVNFPYSGLSDYQMEYYGDHVKKLKKVKLKYDPENLFSFPQGLKGTEDKYCSINFGLDEKEEKELPEQSNDAVYRGFRYIPKKEKSS